MCHFKIPRRESNLFRVANLGHLLILSFALLFVSGGAAAQSETISTNPYATLDRQSVAYRGPGRTAEKMPEDAAVIGMILPLRGPQESKGKSLLAAAQLALELEQSRAPLPDGRKLALVVRDESGPWGQVSTEILKLIEQDHALVLLTSTNGNSAHLAEQIANKISIPILTLASDPTTTETNVPWLFRLGPSDTDQARAFCRQIYTELGLKKVLLITQKDHDGRVGGTEFEKAARDVKADPPHRLEIAAAGLDFQSASEIVHVENPDAIVIWADSPQAGELLPIIHRIQPSAPVFLCQKAAQLNAENGSENSSLVSSKEDRSYGEYFTVDTTPRINDAGDSTFEKLYFKRTGTKPDIAAFETYKAVHLFASALPAAGADRVLLRDYFANDGMFRGAAAPAPFDPSGNSVGKFIVVRLGTISESFSGK
jgi:ABC-type branched-subunit amino acid transport system substrate-binding protein